MHENYYTNFSRREKSKFRKEGGFSLNRPNLIHVAVNLGCKCQARF